MPESGVTDDPLNRKPGRYWGGPGSEIVPLGS
jgi:hypothetical protein